MGPGKQVSVNVDTSDYDEKYERSHTQLKQYLFSFLRVKSIRENTTEAISQGHHACPGDNMIELGDMNMAPGKDLLLMKHSPKKACGIIIRYVNRIQQIMTEYH